MQALGAEVIRTPDDEGHGRRHSPRAGNRGQDSRSVLAVTVRNQANPDYHYETTGRELFEQMGGDVDAVVVGSGTGGTFTESHAS